jgi:hypothetical protein
MLCRYGAVRVCAGWGAPGVSGGAGAGPAERRRHGGRRSRRRAGGAGHTEVTLEFTLHCVSSRASYYLVVILLAAHFLKKTPVDEFIAFMFRVTKLRHPGVWWQRTLRAGAGCAHVAAAGGHRDHAGGDEDAAVKNGIRIRPRTPNV